MKSKHLLVGCIALLAVQFCNAQYLDLKGITVQASKLVYVENKEEKSIDIDQLYCISFIDEMLVHNIYKEGTIDRSQFYKVGDKLATMDGDITKIKFSAVSGKSGNTFKYEIQINKEGKLIGMIVTEPNGDVSTYKGGVIILDTYKQ